jgi:hypothetical protein
MIMQNGAVGGSLVLSILNLPLLLKIDTTHGPWTNEKCTKRFAVDGIGSAPILFLANTGKVKREERLRIGKEGGQFDRVS